MEHSLKNESTRPKQKEVVQLLMKFLREEHRSVWSRKGQRKEQTFLVYECPKGQRCVEGGQYYFPKGFGYSNPFKHLKTCIADGSETHLFEVYKLALQECGGIPNYFPDNSPTTRRLTPRENAMSSYVRLIILKLLPIYIIEDTEFRQFSKSDGVFSRKLFKDTMFHQVEIVEENIRE